MKKLSMIITVGILAAATSVPAVPVRISVTGTANSHTGGYLSEYGPYYVGQSYTFEWVISDGYAGGLNDMFSSTRNDWFSYSPDNDPPLFESFSGDNLVGTYTYPDGDENLSMSSSGMYLESSTGYPITDPMDLICKDLAVKAVHASGLMIPGMDYSDTSFVNPAIWLSSYAGTYALSGGDITILTESSGTEAHFDATSVTISVPEPATFGLIGLSGAFLFLIRRLQKAYGHL